MNIKPSPVDERCCWDTPRTWDIGTCVVWAIMDGMSIPPQHRDMKDRHYLRLIRNMVMRRRLERLMRLGGAGIVRERGISLEQLEVEIAAEIWAVYCSACGDRVKLEAVCSCGKTHNRNANH